MSAPTLVPVDAQMASYGKRLGFSIEEVADDIVAVSRHNYPGHSDADIREAVHKAMTS